MRETNRPMSEQERLTFATWLVRLMLVVALASLGCGGCSFSLPRLSSPTWKEIRDYEYARLVTVRTSCAFPPTHLGGVEVVIPNGQGSGVRIGGSAVLTADHVVHCVIGTPRVTVVDALKHEYSARIVATMDADIARLEVENLPRVDRVRLGSVDAGLELCAVVALPEIGRVCGEVQPSANNWTAGSTRVRFVAEHGNSGGGVWNSRGELVGILVHFRQCQGTEDNKQVCAAGVTALAPNFQWIAAH